MTLSAQQRQALRDRAAGLRAEVDAAKLAAREAVDAASAAVDDTKLMAEVERLEHQKAEALATRDRASGSADNAIRAMEEAAAKLHGQHAPTPDLAPAPAPAPAPEPGPAPAAPAVSVLTGLVDHFPEGADVSGEEN